VARRLQQTSNTEARSGRSLVVSARAHKVAVRCASQALSNVFRRTQAGNAVVYELSSAVDRSADGCRSREPLYQRGAEMLLGDKRIAPMCPSCCCCSPAMRWTLGRLRRPIFPLPPQTTRVVIHSHKNRAAAPAGDNPKQTT